MENNTKTVSQIANCHDCGKEWDDYNKHRARKAAYKHAKKTGHRVSVETSIVTSYN